MQDKYVVLKYLRLSVEDGDNTESDSIANQRNLLDLHIVSDSIKDEDLTVSSCCCFGCDHNSQFVFDDTW